jgi:hypothetical protein
MFRRFAKDRILAPPGFNRWKVPPASIAIHLCIGSVYAWSNFNPALVKVQGVVAAAPGDWTLGQVVWVFTVAIVCLGISAAVAGRKQQHANFSFSFQLTSCEQMAITQNSCIRMQRVILLKRDHHHVLCKHSVANISKSLSSGDNLDADAHQRVW